MSCNITAGIAKGCNDQIGGIQGIHYWLRNPAMEYIFDSNGVVIGSNPLMPFAEYVEATNEKASLIETYNVNSGGSILGFHQSLSFFLPTTATPLNAPANQGLTEFVKAMASQNAYQFIAETDHKAATLSYRPTSFMFGNERGAYTASGNKQTGISYGDDNGYTLEVAADSKLPMFEVDYMFAHLAFNKVYLSGDPAATDLLAGYPGTQSSVNYEPLVKYLGANVRQLIPNILNPEIYVMPGETTNQKVRVAVEWNSNAFDSNGDFSIIFYRRTDTTFTPGTNINPPTAAGYNNTMTVEWPEYTNTGTTVISSSPLGFGGAQDPAQPVGIVDYFSFQILSATRP